MYCVGWGGWGEVAWGGVGRGVKWGGVGWGGGDEVAWGGMRWGGVACVHVLVCMRDVSVV